MYFMRAFMDEMNEQILEMIQTTFPLDSRPFRIIADSVGITEVEVIQRVQSMKDDGLIRRIGAVFSPEKIEMESTLAAVRVPKDSMIETIAHKINGYIEVTHNYQRNHRYNLWFTVVAHSRKRIEAILSEIRTLPGVAELNEFPSVRTFKIDTRFKISEQ